MFRLLLASALALGLAPTASATVIFSDNFDTEVAGTNATLSQWNITAGSVDVIPVGMNFVWYAGNGQYVDMNGSTQTAGRIETKLALGLVAGTRYVLSFDYGNNKNSNAVEQLTYGFAGQQWVIDIPGAVPAFNRVVQTFVFSGTGDRLFFADTGSTPRDNGGPILDNVTLALAPIPLPAGGLLLIGALGGLALLRRRKSAQA